MVPRAKWSSERSNLFWIVIFVVVSGPALVRLVVATIDDPSLLWNALVVIPLVVVGMWLILSAMSMPARQRHRFLIERDPDAIYVHATNVGRSLEALSRAGLVDTDVESGQVGSASLQFTDDSLDIWIGGKSPRLLASFPRANFTGIEYARTIVTAVNPAVSVSLKYQMAGESGEFAFVPSHVMGRPLRLRQVDEILPLLHNWIGNESGG